MLYKPDKRNYFNVNNNTSICSTFTALRGLGAICALLPPQKNLTNSIQQLSFNDMDNCGKQIAAPAPKL